MTHNSSGWKKAGAPIGTCKVCKFMAANPRAAWNRRIIAGESILSLAKEFGCCYGTMAIHAGRGKDKDGNPRIPHFTRQLKAAAKVKDVAVGLDLMECQKKVWDDAQEAIDLSLGRKKPPENPYNLAVFGQCIAPQVKIIEVMAKVNPGDNKDVESDGMIEALKATAKDDWKDTRPIQVATTEPETADGNELDTA